MLYKVRLLFSLFLLFSAAILFSQESGDNYQDLFDKVFADKKAPPVKRVMIPLYVEKQKIDFVAATISNTDITFQAYDLLEALKKLIEPDDLAAVKKEVDAQGNISASALHKLDYKVEFNQTALILMVSVPAKYRLSNDHYIKNRSNPMTNTDFTLPNDFSAYLNMSGSQTYTHNTHNISASGYQPFTASFKSVFNFKGWVAEGYFNFREKRTFPWQLTDQRLIYDLPKKMVRLTFGDVVMRTSGFSSSRDIGGFSLARNFNLQPYTVTAPIHNHEIFLENPSLVEAYVNGNKIKTMRLTPGPHNLVDFPAILGTNDVQLKITDEFGEVRWVDFPFIYESNLLNPGLQEYAYNVGFPKYQRKGIVGYDSANPLISAYHRVGITDIFTCGGYCQANRHQGLLGFEGVVATALGRISFDGASSWIKDIGFSGAGRISFNNYRSNELFEDRTTINLSASYRARYFAAVGNTSPDNINAWTFSTTVGRRITNNCNVSLGGNLQVNRNNNNETYNIFLGAGNSFKNNLDVNVNIRFSQNSDKSQEGQATINLSWRIPHTGNYFSMRYDSSTLQKSLNWNYSPQRHDNNFNFEAGLARDTSSEGANFESSYTADKGIVRLSGSTEYSRTETGTNNTCTLFASSALLFAGGHFAISRPVSNSFAIVVPHQNFKKKTILVNPSEDDYAAKSSIFGPAVISNLAAYQVRRIYIDVLDVPIGYDIGENIYNLLPSYESGFAIPIGTDATVYISGFLEDTNGEPIQLQAGYIFKVSETNWKPITFFTNRKGKFRVMGFSPGKYQIQLMSPKWGTTTFEIPQKTAGLYNLNKIILPLTETSKESVDE